jgi:hypothetical protein
MKIKEFLNFGSLLKMVELSLKTTFNPPDTSSTKQIRINGLIAWLVGFLIMIVNTMAVSIIYRIMNIGSLGLVFFAISLAAVGFMVSGFYRFLTGKKEQKSENEYEISLYRVGLVFISLILSITIPVMIIGLILYYLQSIGIEPNKLFH